jgi:hypothetical protein
MELWLFRVNTAGRGTVVSNHPRASSAGAEMLAVGGNAIDAAIATLFALTAVEPMMVGIIGRSAQDRLRRSRRSERRPRLRQSAGRGRCRRTDARYRTLQRRTAAPTP